MWIKTISDWNKIVMIESISRNIYDLWINDDENAIYKYLGHSIGYYMFKDIYDLPVLTLVFTDITILSGNYEQVFDKKNSELILYCASNQYYFDGEYRFSKSGQFLGDGEIILNDNHTVKTVSAEIDIRTDNVFYEGDYTRTTVPYSFSKEMNEPDILYASSLGNEFEYLDGNPSGIYAGWLWFEVDNSKQYRKGTDILEKSGEWCLNYNGANYYGTEPVRDGEHVFSVKEEEQKDPPLEPITVNFISDEQKDTNPMYKIFNSTEVTK